MLGASVFLQVESERAGFDPSAADGLSATVDNSNVSYDEQLAGRLRELLRGEPGLTEKRMFGGLAFLINGNMSVSASGQGGLLLRVDPDETDKLLSEPGAQRFEMRGRSMAGWLRVTPNGLGTDRELERWVNRSVGYARSLAPKQGS